MKKKKPLTILLKMLGGIVGVLAVLVVGVLTALLYVETHDFRDWKGIDKTEFSCFRDDLTIRGTVFAPSGQENLPIAIVCHEFMANRLFSYPYAMALARSGYAAFCFDFCGGGIVCGSDGESRDMSVLTEMEDLNAVIAFARAQRYTGDAPLLLVGCSQGGLVATLTAAELQAEVGGLILHGDRDTLVDIAGSRRAANAYEAAGADVQFHVIPDGTHIFLNPKHIRMAADLTGEFAARIHRKE